MSTCTNNTITDWKRLWQLVSGIHHETPEDTVLEELLNVSKELTDGLLQFRATNSSKTKLEDLLQEKKQEKLLAFTQRLQDLLDLESKQCWDILCYYLKNEYRGTAGCLTALIATETSMTKLLDDIWGYYTLERMIVLKIVKNLLVFYDVPNHPYQREYKQIVDKIELRKLRDSYMKQLEHLIDESPPSKLSSGEFFNFNSKLIVWAERNAREINEVLHILLLICEHLPLQLDDVKRLFACFKRHSFGKQQNYLDRTYSVHAELMNRLASSEIILFLKCIDFEQPDRSSGLAHDIIAALDKDICRMYDKAENGPLLLGWMLLYVRCTNASEEEEAFRKCRHYGKRALDLNCFGYMRDMLANPMFKDDSLVSRIARKTIYNLLSHMCDFFDRDGSCAAHANIYELLAELLMWPTLAKEFCCHEEGGVRSLYNTLLETFPIDFTHLSMLATALTNGGMGSYIKTQLESLPILTDVYDETKYQLRCKVDDEFTLLRSVRPFARIDFEIPACVSAVVMSRPQGYFVHFRTPVNYFDVLHHEMNSLLTDAMQLHGDFESSERVKRVNAGLEYLVVAVKRIKSVAAISVEMVHPTEMCIDLLNKFKLVQNPPVALLANCLKVCTALLPLVDSEILTRVVNLSILPAIGSHTLDFRQYADGMSFDSCLIGTYLVDVEKKLGRFDFLLAYMGFLRSYTKLQRNQFYKVEIPGLLFLLREVFPHIYTWRYTNETDKNKIYLEIMGFICDILDSVTVVDDIQSKENDEKRLMRDLCIYSLLNLENGLMLLRFVAVGNAYLQHTMEMESNWMLQHSNTHVLLVRLSMRILMQLLRLKKVIFHTSDLSPLEALIYTQPKQRDTLRIIPVVTSYMSNIFDRWLPILSCRLLKRIALEFNMSLLACLDMEPDQIRLIFLQKLPDELESDNLKIAILELVEACIGKQPGVTEAFFKVNSTQDKRIFAKDTNKQIADSILMYIEDYLEAVWKDPSTVEDALPSKIMNLIHSLWKHNMQTLVAELVDKPKFWEKLCSPLFGDLKPDVRSYTQLLNIIAIELYSPTQKSSDELKSVVERFLEPANFEKWLDFLFDMPKTPYVRQFLPDIISDDMPEWLCRLQAFKGFMFILIHLDKKRPEFLKIPAKQFKTMAEKILKVLVCRGDYLEDLRPFILLTEMYLCVLVNLKHSYTESADEDREMMCQVIRLVCQIQCCYEDLHVRAKEASLAIIIKCAQLLRHELMNDSSVALTFLHSVVSIICMELQNLESCVRNDLKQRTPGKKDQVPEANNINSSNTLSLCLNLLKTVAMIFHNDSGPANWDSPFLVNKVFQRLLSCTSTILQEHKKRDLSVELLDVLILFAKGNCSAEFMHCDVGDYLWLRLLPPKELLQANFVFKKPVVDTWTVQEWWPIYARGIQLVTILFQRHSHHFLKEALQFVGIQEEYLMDSLMLGSQSLESPAMNLIKSAVTLMSGLAKFEQQWRLDHPQSMVNLMRGVQVLFGHSISMFHQPKNLKCLIAGRRSTLEILRTNDNSDLNDEAVKAFNELSEIIILCAKCLQCFSPNLMDLICEPEFLLSKWEPILEVHFGAPKLTDTEVSLTFGAVLSIVSVYTKVLNLQHFGFHDLPLNELPGESENPSNPTVRSRLLTTTATTHSASLSFATNELLANLDGDICLNALEHVLTFVASQSLLALRNCYMQPREKQLVKREISAELMSYHEFVRKRVLADHRESRSIWHRRKHGQVMMSLAFNDKESGAGGGAHIASTSRASAAEVNRRHSADLRVNVVRRLHLQQHRTPPALSKQPSRFDMSHVISPIGGQQQGGSAAGSCIASTPNLGRSALRRQGDAAATQADQTKRVHYAEDQDVTLHEPQQENEEEELEMVPPEEPTYTTLSYVQLVEEDYLHFMSNLFSIICQSD